jgi:hypothetical protein
VHKLKSNITNQKSIGTNKQVLVYVIEYGANASMSRRAVLKIMRKTIKKKHSLFRGSARLFENGFKNLQRRIQWPATLKVKISDVSMIMKG